MTTWLALVLAHLPFQVGEDVLRVGETIEGEITDDERLVHTKTLDEHYTDASSVGRSFVLEVDEPGPHTIDLRSYFFDAYLVLRDAEGNVLAEDDDGLIGTHARIVAELDAGETYRVDACALHGKRGRFELGLRSGATSMDGLSARERASLEIEDAERRVQAKEKVLGPDHPDVAESLNKLGVMLYRQGDYARARPLLERDLAITEKVHGPEHRYTAATLNILALVLDGQGDYAAARPLFERALAIFESTRGPEHPDTASCLNNLALLLERQGDFARALPLHERALAIAEKTLGPEHPDVAGSLSSLAVLLRSQGDLAGARPLHERALAIREKTLGPEHPSTARSLSNLALVLEDQGDPAGARRLEERSLAIREKVLGPEHASVARSLNNLAGMLESQGDPAGARPLLERSLAILEKVLGPEHPSTATSLNSLALLLDAQGDHAGARRLQERSLAIREKVLGPDHPGTATSLNNLALLLDEQGDHAGARPLQERAFAIREKVLGPEHPDVAKSLSNLALMHRRQGDYAGARPLYERALAIKESALGPEHPGTSTTQSNLAATLFDSGDAEAAWGLLSRAAYSRSGHLRGVLQGLSEAESYRYLSELRWQLETQLSVASALGDAETLCEAYEGLLAWKGRIARVLMASREQLARELDEEQSGLVEELRGAQGRLSRLLSREPPVSAEERADHRSRLDDLRKGRNSLELALKRSLEAEDQGPIPTAFELAAALPGGSAVVDLFVHRVYEPASYEGGELALPGRWSDDRVSAWIVRAGESKVVHADLGPAAAMQTVTRDHLHRLVSDGVARGTRLAAETDEASDPGETLADLLWAPLSEHLKGVDTVFVSPDSFLGGLPLETIERKDGSYLVEDVAFVYQQDVSSLARAGSGSSGSMDSLLSVGGVDFGGRSAWEGAVASAGSGRSNTALRGSFTERWSFLPGTDDESRAVHALHEETRGEESQRLLLQGPAPTEERLKHELSSHSVLHLATHGFFQPEGTPSMWESAVDERGQQKRRMSDEAEHLVGKHPGLLSGLVCAGANRPPEGEGDDGYLTAEEVGWLDLTDVELVVMSACETGLGRAESGEGLIGLRRAFRTAGAKTVVSSLWSVGDESTAELMRDFYVNLWTKGMGRLEALRAAQLAMLERNREEHGAALPSTWGAFVLSGEWR